MASDVQQVARFRAARVVGSARRDREQADQLVEEARRQVDEYLDEGRSRAEAHAQAVWHRARARLHEPMLEVEETRLQGRALRRELRRLRELRDEYWGRVTGHPDGLAEEDTQFA
jgi:vacuolar-type H+-ATPase subunit H